MNTSGDTKKGPIEVLCSNFTKSLMHIEKTQSRLQMPKSQNFIGVCRRRHGGVDTPPPPYGFRVGVDPFRKIAALARCNFFKTSMRSPSDIFVLLCFQSKIGYF